MNTMPATKTARQAKITAILTGRVGALAGRTGGPAGGRRVQVTQATLSRDLVELGAVRVRGQDGGLIYAVPERGRRPQRRRAGESARKSWTPGWPGSARICW